MAADDMPQGTARRRRLAARCARVLIACSLALATLVLPAAAQAEAGDPAPSGMPAAAAGPAETPEAPDAPGAPAGDAAPEADGEPASPGLSGPDTGVGADAESSDTVAEGQGEEGGPDAGALSGPVAGGASEPAGDTSTVPAADDGLFVSAAGSDATGDGSRGRPFATLSHAVERSSASQTIVILDDIVATTTAQVGAKDIVVRGDAAASAVPTVTGSTATTLFAVGTGSLMFEDVVFDGASAAVDHRVADVSGAGGSLVLGSGASVRNWHATGTAGAVRVRANGGSFTMKSDSTMADCLLIASSSYAGGAAANVTAARSSGTGTSPSASYRAAFAMEGGALLENCDVQMTANAAMAGGGAVHAADAVVDVQEGAVIRGCDLVYRTAAGALLDPTGVIQGGGAVFANNCKVDMAGTVEDCHMEGSENTGTGNFYAGGGALFLYDYGCAPGIGVDCRTVVSGTVSDCSAIAGGGVFYWSQADGYDQGDNLWTGSGGPLTSAAQVVDKVYDTLSISGSVRGCSTDDPNTARRIDLSNYGDFERYGIGGGAVCGAYTGLIVLDDGALISGCSTGSEGGGVSNYGVSVFCLSDGAGPGTGPVVEGCSAGGIAGGISAGAATSIEDVEVRDCTAGLQGGGLFVYSGSTTLYDCLVTGCSAGQYGGGIMQHVVHDLFMYGGTVTGNHAGTGGGGLALDGHSGGSATAPRGVSFNYPATLNGGYTNPVYYKSAILADKIVAATVIAQNTQGAAATPSDLWTPSSAAATRISLSGAFLPGSKLGVTVADGSSSYNKAGTPFGNASQPNLDLGAFASNRDTTLAAVYRGSNLYWADGFTVSYDANVPVGAVGEGEAPFDGIAGIPNAYARSGGEAIVLDAGTLAVPGYRFLGWSEDADAPAASYAPGEPLAYAADADPDGDGRIVLRAVWEKVVVHASVSFVKTGTDQQAGTGTPLSGAVFGVYRYVGDVGLDAVSVNGGSIDLASPASTQWAPVTGTAGEEGAAGSGEEPLGFASSDGTDGVAVGMVTLEGLAPGEWYMLVETSAPAGYQLPAGQWAFKAVESPSGAGSYAIDVHQLLARQGADGSLPPAFATSIQTGEGAVAGLFLPNVPVFVLPMTGVPVPWQPLLLGAGALLAAAGLAATRRGGGRP